MHAIPPREAAQFSKGPAPPLPLLLDPAIGRRQAARTCVTMQPPLTRSPSHIAYHNETREGREHDDRQRRPPPAGRRRGGTHGAARRGLRAIVAIAHDTDHTTME